MGFMNSSTIVKEINTFGWNSDMELNFVPKRFAVELEGGDMEQDLRLSVIFAWSWICRT